MNAQQRDKDLVKRDVASVNPGKQHGLTRADGELTGGEVENDPKRSNEAPRKPAGPNVGNSNSTNDRDRAPGAGGKGSETTGGDIKNDAERTSQAGYEGGKT